MAKNPHELIICGKVERFSNSPMGNALRLVDANNKDAIWSGDDILGSFEGKGEVCLQVKMVRRKRNE